MRPRLLIVTLVAFTLTLAGCSWNSPPAENPPVETPAPSPSAPADPPSTGQGDFDRMDAAADDPNAAALAAQAEAYARGIEAMIDAKRNGSPARPTAPVTQDPTRKPAGRAALPSEVQWMDAGEFRLSVLPEQPHVDAPRPAQPERATPAVDRRPADATPSAANRGIEIEDVQPVSNPQIAMAPTNPPVATDAVPAVRAAPQIAMEQQLLQRIRDYPQDVSAHLDYQLFMFLRDEPVPNLSAMSSLPAEDRELITSFMDGMSNFRNAIRADANMLLSRKVRPLVDMADRLRSRADLSIPTIALCRKVEGFGRYEPIEPARFVAGKAHPVIIYCEVENFTSQLNDGKMWETKLSQDAVLYTENGLPVWSNRDETFTDLARNRRRDFFVVKLVTLPDNLVIGRYLLKVSIVDQQSNRVAEANLPVQIVAGTTR